MIRTQASRLESLVEIIRQTSDPERIILFGSRAKGTGHAGSDYDFLEDKPGVILDYGADGALVSLEIVDASERVSTPSRIAYQVAKGKDHTEAR